LPLVLVAVERLAQAVAVVRAVDGDCGDLSLSEEAGEVQMSVSSFVATASVS